MFTTACCLVAGLGLGLDLASGWQVVMLAYLCCFRLSLQHAAEGRAFGRGTADNSGPHRISGKSGISKVKRAENVRA